MPTHITQVNTALPKASHFAACFMRGLIKKIVTRPLLVPYKKPLITAYGKALGACALLVEVHSEEGVVGYGETIGTPSMQAMQTLVDGTASLIQGRSVFENSRLWHEIYKQYFMLHGTCSAPRFGAQMLAGLDMALWDVAGKICQRPVYDLIGGKVRESIPYFGFVQGETPDEMASDAHRLQEEGHEVLYAKLGRGDIEDLAIVKAIRKKIGRSHRLRLDPNEAWDPVRCKRMVDAIEEFGPIDFLEQPCLSSSIQALASIRASSRCAIAADQSVFSPFDILDAVQKNAADVFVLGLHETGGLGKFMKAAAIAEAAGRNICLHGLYETGITTCASMQVAAAIPNLDDGNQYMNDLLQYDIIAAPSLEKFNGAVSLPSLPGLGFELDEAAVGMAEEAFKKAFGSSSLAFL